ncbi:MAG: DedA family protein [Thermoleophilia bacterium]|nr:DedA family protein [Thermoleophilia bacterium]
MPVASVLSAVTEAVVELIGDHGLYAVFLLMLVDAVLPAASELVMVYGGAVAAGAFAGQHVVLFGERLDEGFPAYLAIAVAGTVGYTIGSVGGWLIGLYGGRPLVDRHGRWLHVGPERLERAERWFARWGDAAVFLGRITPVVRSFVAIPAGVFRLRLVPYSALTLLGSAIWCFAFAGIGWALGSNWERFHDAFKYADYAVAALLVAAVAYLLFRARARTRRRALERST